MSPLPMAMCIPRLRSINTNLLWTQCIWGRLNRVYVMRSERDELAARARSDGGRLVDCKSQDGEF